MIPFANPKASYLAHKAEIDTAVARVLDSGWYVLGREVAAFEAEFAAWLGAGQALGVGSGTEAIHLALKALGIGPGDEVATVSHTAVATVAAIELAGATPVFADIDPQACTMSPESLGRIVTARTKAIVPVHLYGHPADMEAILAVAAARGIPVVEDCAQAHGAELHGRRVGTFGQAACFSFYPTKNLGALGDGGAVTTSDPALFERMRLLREYGWRERYVSEIAGWNTRLDEIQAAILRVKLAHLDADNAARRRLAEFYLSELDGLGLVLPRPGPGVQHAWHLFVVRSARRDALLKGLRERGVGAAVHYPKAVHEQPAYARLARPLPETERAVREVLSLPLYPELTEAEVRLVTAAIRDLLT